MSVRGPKSVKLYHNGELCAEMESVKAAVDFLVLHDMKHRCWDSVRILFKDARDNNTELFGFTFVEDPDWESRKVVMATDIETDESFVKPSVGEMARVIFGPSKLNGASRVSEYCRNGKTYRGLTFRYVGDGGYSVGYRSKATDSGKKPIQQLVINTGVVINEFLSIADAAQHIWDMKLSSASCVKNILAALSECANGAPKYNGKYLGYRWRFRPNSN